MPKSNKMIKRNYLILDENMRFLDKNNGEKKASENILNIGVKKVMTQMK